MSQLSESAQPVTSTGMPVAAASGDNPVDLRVIYASAVYGQEEIDAVRGRIEATAGPAQRSRPCVCRRSG